MEKDLNPEVQPQAGGKEYKEPAKIENAQQVLKDSAAKLIKYGGFKVFESCIKGTQNLNPDKKATRSIFLTEASRKAERETLKSTLNIWLDLLTENETVADMVAVSQGKAESAGNNLKVNVKKALDETRELEAAYRSVSLFYKNAEADKLKNITIMNASLEQLNNLDVPIFIDAINNEFKDNFDVMDYREHYSLLVVPGWLGSNLVVEKLGKIAHESKVMMITDYRDMESADDLLQSFQLDNLTGGDKFRSNIMMTANWLVARGKDAEMGEEEDVHVPASAALAGKVYSTLMSQVAAGKKFGALNEVPGAVFDLRRTEFGEFEKNGLIPMVNEYNKVLPMSAKTLFNGDNIGWQTYSIVRVFDYIMKCLFDFLNRRTFENFNPNMRKEIQETIIKFLDKLTGPGNLIEKFEIVKFEQDPNQRDRVFLDISITPFFPMKNIKIGLTGEKGENSSSSKWGGEVT